MTQQERKQVKTLSDVNKLIATNSNDKNIIGNLVYFTIGSANISSATIIKMAKDSGLPEEYFTKEYKVRNAFERATRKFLHLRLPGYNINLYRNQKEGQIYRREIKQEIIGALENEMISLGNIWIDENTKLVNYSINEDNVCNLTNVNLKEQIRLAIEYFNDIIDTKSNDILTHIIKTRILKEYLKATDIAIHGNLYFVPGISQKELSSLEIFFDMLEEEHSKVRTDANGGVNFVSIPVVNSEKLIREYSGEFVRESEKKIEFFKEKLKSLNENGVSRITSINTIKNSLEQLEERKKIYEESLNTKIEDLNLDMKIIQRELEALESKYEQKKKRPKTGLDNLKNQIKIDLF